MTSSMSVPAARLFGQRAILISIALGCMLVPLNSTMIAIALPEIMQDFRVYAAAPAVKRSDRSDVPRCLSSVMPS